MVKTNSFFLQPINCDERILVFSFAKYKIFPFLFFFKKKGLEDTYIILQTLEYKKKKIIITNNERRGKEPKIGA